MRLAEGYYREILAHAEEGKPNEICGLIAGRDGVPVKLWRTTNNDSNPRVRYNVEPLELLNVLREIDAKRWNLLAIYHSHPATEAYPSATDIGLAYYPEAVYIIVSLAFEEPVARAFRIVDGEVVEEPLEILQESTEPVVITHASSGPEPVVQGASGEGTEGVVRRVLSRLGWFRPRKGQSGS